MISSMRSVLRLYRWQNVFYQNKLFSPRQASTGCKTKENQDKLEQNKDFRTLLQLYKDKIIFNSYLEHEKLDLGYYRYYLKTIKKAKETQKREYEEKCLPALPVSLKYIVGEDKLLKEHPKHNISEPDDENTFHMPYGKTTFTQTSSEEVPESEFDRSNIKKWMVNYEYFDDSKLQVCEEDEENNEDINWEKHYGTADPNAAISQVPCGGCGALLHCSDPAIPGYLPSEIYKGREVEELKEMECQRCHFLKEYNIALDVTVEPEEYEKLLQSIRNVKSLVLLMVDLLDFPCSIWPGIVDIIGTSRPIIIVGNKIDLLPGDSVGYVKRIKECLMTEIKKTRLSEANIKYVALVSAKTGYGVENLISAMFKHWMGKGDVFLVGCTNVGKSSLFNALLQSDYCKVHAVDIVKRATVSRWPGTTLNLLKFPINRPSGWKIYQRTKRLQSEAKFVKLEKEIRNSQLQGQIPTESPALIGHIGRSFSVGSVHDDSPEERRHLRTLDEGDRVFRHSHWFYDTPGVMLPDQLLSLLTTEELLLTVPKQLIRPQTYYLPEKSTIFIGGLARLDLLECSDPCRFTIFCAESLPITVVKTEHADEVYSRFAGTELLAVPAGGAARARGWPGLRRHARELRLRGEGPHRCCGDVVLGAAGWAAVTARAGAPARLAAWLPGAAAGAVACRVPALLPYAVKLKGKRVDGTPAYMIGKVFSDKE